MGLLLLASAVAGATETRRWVVDTAADFLKGEGEGVAVTTEGRLVAVPAWRSALSFEEPVVLAGAVAEDGSLVVGTGHPARLYRVEDGKAELLTEVPGEQITAVLAEEDGAVVVATMAPGALFRFRKGELEELGRLDEGGFWDLALLDGQVVAAAGPPAALYRVASRGLERWMELPDAFVRCLEVAGERLFVGTSGKGLVFSVDGRGVLGVVNDSQFTEVSDLVAAPDGSLWATVLVGEPPPKPAPPKKSDSGNGNGQTETATVDIDLPKVDGATATSELLRLTPEGGVLKVHRFTKQVASALAWDGEGVLVGTGYDGELWRFTPLGGARLATIDAVQTVAIVGGGEALLTQGPAQLLRRDPRPEQARFRSGPLELEQPARWGRFEIWPPAGEGVRIRFRSGISGKSDDGWLAWSEWLAVTDAELPVAPARSLQWELELAASGSAAVQPVERVEVAYRELNLPPTLEDVELEDPGVIYLGAPPPSGPVIEASNPDVSGIFTVLGEDKPNGASAKGKKYWRVGYRTVSWKGEDPNDDPLHFRLELERADGFRLEVRDELTVSQLAVDTTAVPDGRYRFRVTASDAEANPGEGLETVAASRWMVVDNTPPVITVERKGDRWQVQVVDELSPIAKLEWSRDGDRWQGLAPGDGVLDGRSESFSLAASRGSHLVAFRAVDVHHNRATAGVTEE